MATKKTTPNKINNDFDLNKALDFDMFDFKDPTYKDDRKPIVRAATAAAKGAFKAPRDSAFLKRTLKDALPKGFGQSWDAIDKATDSVRNLYDESAREIKPALREGKRVLAKMIPRESKMIPKIVQKQLSKWEKEVQDERRSARPSQFAERESGIEQNLAMFKITQQQLAEERAQADGKDRLRQGVEMTRHRELSNWMARTAVSVDKIQKYQSSITLGYQKKSLEVQMRSLFMLQDMLAFAKEDAYKRDALLLAISKNTTLPDAVKINSKEAREVMARNKWNESIHRGLFGGRDDIVEKTLGRVSNMVLNQVRGVAGMAQQGIMAANMADGAGGGFGGPDKYQLGGEFLGESLGRAGARFLGNKAKKGLSSGRFDRFGGKRVLKAGMRLEDMNENMSQRLNAFRKSDKYMFDDSMKGGVMRFLQNLLPGMGPETALRLDSAKDMDSPASPTKRTNKSINDIIPGYLSRILRELQVQRTGNPNIELTTYNYGSSKFTSKGKAEAQAFKEIINGKAAKRTNAQLDQLLNQIDPSGKALSPQARQELKKKLLNTSANNDEANRANLAMYGSYKGVQEKLVDEIVPVMRQFFDNLSDDRKVEFSRASNSLAGSMADPRQAIQQQADFGNLQYLKRMGFVERDGKNIDMAKIIDYVLDPANSEKVQAMASDKYAGGSAFQSMARNLSPQGSLRERAAGAMSAAKSKIMGGVNNSQAIVADVYVAGENAPRILAQKLQMGVYRDRATKKVITTIDQIKGAVEDTSANNAVVVEPKDLLRLTFVSPATQTVERLKTAQEGLSNFLTENNVPRSMTDLATLIKRKSAEAGFNDEILDVYVEGEGTPRMTAAKLKAGLYRDLMTGKTIRHQSEINGEVADEEDKVVLSIDDMPKLRVWESRNQRFGLIRRMGANALLMAKGLWWVQTKVMVPWAKWNVKQLWNVTKGIGKAAKRVFGNVARDVFVQGEAKPRMYAARMLAGEYRDLESGERILHQDQITGPVIDRDDQIVLDTADLDKLQVYNNVLRIFNPFRLLKWAGKKVGQGLWWLAKGVQTKVAPALSKAILRTFKAGLYMTARAMDVCVKGDPNPRLLGYLMRQGKYVVAATGKVIRNIRDITGAVMGPEGMLITQDEYERGLTRLDGKPLLGGLSGAVSRGFGALNRMMSMRVKLKSGAAREAATGALLKNRGVSAGDKTVMLLQDIKDIFARKFGGGLFGDSNGDGMRDGSWQATLRNKVAGATGGFSAGKAGAGAAAGGGLLSGLKSLLMGRKKSEDEDGYGMGDALEDASNADDLLDRGGRRGRGRGRLGRMAGRFGRFAKWGKVAGAGALMGAAAYGTDALAGKVGVGKNTLDNAQDDANWANMSAWEKVQSGFARGTEKIGSLAFLGNFANQAAQKRIGNETEYMQSKASGHTPGKGLLDYLMMASPLGIGMGLGSLFGGPGAKNTAYDDIRYVQYGFSDKNVDARSKAGAMEDYLQTLVVDGVAVSLDDSKMDVPKVMTPWGFDPKNNKHVEIFFGWFKNRFKPVYLIHLNAVKRFTGKADLRNVGAVKKEDQAAYVDAIRFAGGPYDYRTMPSPSGSMTATDAFAVEAAVNKAIKDMGVKKDAKVDPGKTAAVAAAAAQGLAAAPAKPVSAMQSFLNTLGLGDSKLPTIGVGATSAIGKDAFSQSRDVKALEAVRFKVYGQAVADVATTLSLRTLESFMAKYLKFGGDGKASFDGNALDVLSRVQGQFGISDLTGKFAAQWVRWFKNRFLPVYLAFTSSYRNLVGKEDYANAGSVLKPNDQVQIAQLLAGLSGIWMQTDSPWGEIPVNTDPKSVDTNIAFLKLAAADEQLKEQKAPEKAASKAPEQQSLWQRAKSSVTNLFSSEKASTNKLPAVTSPDAEAPVKGTTGISPVAVNTGGSAGTPAMAGGELSDGRNAMAHLSIRSGVVLDGMNPTFMKNFYGMAEEYGKLTGKKIGINDAFRSYEAQVAAKKKYGARAASPGSSLHEFGLAMDIDSKTLDEMDKMGLMRKYGFTRPVGGEAWHMEPIGIQTDIAAFKKDQELAAKAITAGVGKGGGGFGTVESAPKYSRNRDLAMSIMQSSSSSTVDNTKLEGGTGAQLGAAAGAANNTPRQGLGAPASGMGGRGGSLGIDGGVSASADGETKPSGSGVGAAMGANSPGSSPSGINSRQTAMPADPTVKVPDPKGSGYAGMKDTIEAAAKLVGVDPNTMVRMAAIESGFNPSAAASTSSASGLFQFTNDTWRAMIAKYGRLYGYTSQTPSTDPKASAIMAAHMLKDSSKFVGSKIKRPFGATEAYMTHFLGAGGAVQFLQALEANPGASAAEVMPKAAKANQAIFYNNGRARTLQEVYALLDNKVNGKGLQAFGIPNVEKSNAALAASAGDPSTQGTETAAVSRATQGAAAGPGASTAAAAGAVDPTAPTTNANGSPLADVYGFKPAQASQRLAPNGQPNQLDPSIMTKTEGILTEQLEVTKQMAGYLLEIMGLVKSQGGLTGAAAPAGTPNDPSSTGYTVPKPRVNMARTTT